MLDVNVQLLQFYDLPIEMIVLLRTGCIRNGGFPFYDCKCLRQPVMDSFRKLRLACVRGQTQASLHSNVIK